MTLAMRSVLFVLVLVGLAACSRGEAQRDVAPIANTAPRDAGGIDASPYGTRAQCEALLDHLIDLELGANKDAQMKASIKSAKSDEFIQECTTKTKAETVTCALAAQDTAAMAACDE